MEDTQPTVNTEHNPALNVFAVLGFIALLIIGLWSVIQLVQQGSRLISGMNTGTSNSLSLSLLGSGVAFNLDSTKLTSETPTTINFRVGSKTDSVLAFSYACRENFYFEVQTGENTAYAIPCNAPYALDKESSALTLIPILNASMDIEVPVTLSLTPVSGNSITDSATFTIAPARDTQITQRDEVVPVLPVVSVPKNTVVTEAVVVPEPAKEVITKMVPVKKSNPEGLPDLTVKIVKIGVRNADGDVVAKSNFSANDAPVVEFEVTNMGTKVASGWKFSADLPTNPAYTYESPAQAALYAGAVANLSMSFDKLVSGTGMVRITIDPKNSLVEAVETNNGAAKQIIVQ